MEHELLRRLSPAEGAMLFELLRKVAAARTSDELRGNARAGKAHARAG